MNFLTVLFFHGGGGVQNKLLKIHQKCEIGIYSLQTMDPYRKKEGKDTKDFFSMKKTMSITNEQKLLKKCFLQNKFFNKSKGLH